MTHTHLIHHPSSGFFLSLSQTILFIYNNIPFHHLKYTRFHQIIILQISPSYHLFLIIISHNPAHKSSYTLRLPSPYYSIKSSPGSTPFTCCIGILIIIQRSAPLFYNFHHKLSIDSITILFLLLQLLYLHPVLTCTKTCFPLLRLTSLWYVHPSLPITHHPLAINAPANITIPIDIMASSDSHLQNGFSNNQSSQTAQTSELAKEEIGWYFVERYYNTLSKSPEKLYLLYSKRSQFVAGVEEEKVQVSIGNKACGSIIDPFDLY